MTLKELYLAWSDIDANDTVELFTSGGDEIALLYWSDAIEKYGTEKVYTFSKFTPNGRSSSIVSLEVN